MPLRPAASSTQPFRGDRVGRIEDDAAVTARNMAMSSSPIWDGPSSPMETPAWDPANLMFAFEYWLIRIWSKALREEGGKGRDEGQLSPRREADRGAHHVLLRDDTSRSTGPGKASSNISAYVELLTSPSRTTMSGNAG